MQNWDISRVIRGVVLLELNDFQPNVWEAKWIPWLSSFRVITPVKPKASLIRVADLTDRDSRGWGMGMIDHIFFPRSCRDYQSYSSGSVWPIDR